MTDPRDDDLGAILAPLREPRPHAWRVALTAASQRLEAAGWPAAELEAVAAHLDGACAGVALTEVLLDEAPDLVAALAPAHPELNERLEWLALAPSLLASDDQVSWSHGLEVMREQGRPLDATLLLDFLLEHEAHLQRAAAARGALAGLLRRAVGPGLGGSLAELLAADAEENDPALWRRAVPWLQHLGGPAALETLCGIVRRSPTADAVPLALRAAARLERGRAEQVVAQVLAQPVSKHTPDWARRVHVAVWRQEGQPHDDASRAPLLRVLGDLFRASDLHEAHVDEAARQLTRLDAALRVEVLAEAVARARGDATTHTRALTWLPRLDPGGPWAPLVLPGLRDENIQVRVAALEALAGDQVQLGPALLEEVLPLARDRAVGVRQAALKTLARRAEERRARGELVSALWDADENTRGIAESLLGEHEPPLDGLGLLGLRPRWQVLRDRVNEILRWGQEVGQELLGRPIRLRQHPEGLGRTWRSKTGPVLIEISDRAVTHAALHGEDVMAGLILHEVGHHLYDFAARGHRTMTGIARSEKISDLYEILLDERLERKLRARRPEWGHLLDRLASYAFAQGTSRMPLELYALLWGSSPDETAAAIRQGDLPGELLPVLREGGERWVGLTGREVIRVPNLLGKVGLFLAFLRCGFDRSLCRDADVLAALDLIPKNLKDLPHSELVKIARELARVLGHVDQRRAEMARLGEVAGEARGGLRGLERLVGRQGHVCGDHHQHGPPGGAPIREFDPLPDASSSPQGAATPATFESPPRARGRGGRQFNTNPGKTFTELEQQETLAHEPAAHAALVASIRRHVRALRSYLERLGKAEVDQYASRRGRRLDLAQARRSVAVPTPNLLVHRRDVIAPDAYVGIVIDRSGSMSGERLECARAFGCLLAESARGLRGIEGHVNAFDDRTFLRLGGFQRSAVASLTSGGGNNDAGGLARAAELAFRSGRPNKLLVMISDGLPTECTFESLADLVRRLTGRGVVCAQVAVAPLARVAFPNYVDLSQHSVDESVARFGRLLVRLTRGWRGSVTAV